MHVLRTSGMLPHAEPSFQLTPHTTRSAVRCYAMGILASGFLVWLITTILVSAVTSATGLADPSRGVGGSPIFGGLFMGFILGTCGFVIPGILVGAYLWIRESKARVHETVGRPYRAYWQHRQGLIPQLQLRQITAQEAADSLVQFHQDAYYDAEGNPLDEPVDPTPPIDSTPQASPTTPYGTSSMPPSQSEGGYAPPPQPVAPPQTWTTQKNNKKGQ